MNSSIETAFMKDDNDDEAEFLTAEEKRKTFTIIILNSPWKYFL